MSNAPHIHIPTNLPQEEREALAREHGIDLDAPAQLPDPGAISAIANPHVPTNAAAEEDAAKERAFFEEHASALEGTEGSAFGGDTFAIDGGSASALAALDKPLIVVPEHKPPYSLHDLAALAGTLLVGWSTNSKFDDQGATIRGGALEVDDTTIDLAVDAAAKIYLAAEKRLSR